MRIYQSSLKQVVFKVAAFWFDATVKTSSPLPDCRVNHMLVKLIPRRHNVLTQHANVIDAMLVDLSCITNHTL